MRRKILFLLTAGMVIIGVGAAAFAEAGGKAGWHRTSAIGAGIFNWLDTNADGAVTLGEVGDRRGSRFDIFDRNGDGTVTRAEVERVLEARLDRMRDRILARFDGNNDGVVTRAEYDARATRRFARFDSDSDGRVTRQEFDAVRADWQVLRGRMHEMGARFWRAPNMEPDAQKE